MSHKKQESKVTLLGGGVRKGDTSALITNGADAFPEDEFQGSYWTGGTVDNVSILEPQFKPGTLWALCSQNNTLAQCVEAMEVNIDGTGHSIDLADEETPEDEAEKQMLADFFTNPYPGKTMISIRRVIRRDIEATGNGYMEVIRSAVGDVVLINDLDAQYMRLVALDSPVPVPKEIMRRGKPISVQLNTRERRFVQMINGNKVYFKEFGASRDLNRLTGAWAEAGSLPVSDRASEVLHFIGNKEPKTAYGTPRWLNQLPSILGSRKAEEHNLDFFDSGGLPPVLIMVQGGTLGDTAKEDLKQHLNGTGNKHRAAIVEAVSTSGSLDSSGSVQVKVERFGSERQSDAMFQTYDKNCEEHTRIAFRLSPMFIGKAADYNFATAYTAYMVAEAQVFWPERQEFDDKINSTLVKALGAEKYIFRSLPLTLVDVNNQLKALELVADKSISGEELISKLNEITGLSMEYEKQEAPTPPAGKIDPITGMPYAQPAPPPAAVAPEKTAPIEPAVAPDAGGGVQEKRPVGKSDSESMYLLALANRFVNVMGLEGESRFSVNEQDVIRKEVSTLPPEDVTIFNQMLASKMLVSVSVDGEGLSELCGCATHLATV